MRFVPGQLAVVSRQLCYTPAEDSSIHSVDDVLVELYDTPEPYMNNLACTKIVGYVSVDSVILVVACHKPDCTTVFVVGQGSCGWTYGALLENVKP